LTGISAAGVWRLVPRTSGDVHVCVPGAKRRHRPGIRYRRLGKLAESDITSRFGLRVTSLTRTILDLAATHDGATVKRALNEARVVHRLRDSRLRALLARTGGCRGAAHLERLLAHEAGPQMTRSKAERLMLALLRRATLPAPTTNTVVAGHELDLFWSNQRLNVEIDGFVVHSTRASFEADRRRDAELQSIGYQIARFTWRQIIDEPEAVAARVASMLALRTPRGS